MHVYTHIITLTVACAVLEILILHKLSVVSTRVYSIAVNKRANVPFCCTIIVQSEYNHSDTIHEYLCALSQ